MAKQCEECGVKREKKLKKWGRPDTAINPVYAVKYVGLAYGSWIESN
jgi:hypothetical protein